MVESQARVTDYWTRHNVTSHKAFASAEESLEYFHWRCDQYPGYLDLMPVDSASGLQVLDYGCGPGHDLVGFVQYSRTKRLTGVDVSPSSLSEARQRLSLHPGSIELKLLPSESEPLPFGDDSFDYVHSSGVLHHVPDLAGTLREFRRILRPDGIARVMVYNYQSVWLHLYVAYRLRRKEKTISSDLPIRKAFALSTDGPECPIANCYTEAEFMQVCSQAGLSCRRIGEACSLFEMQQLQALRLEACMSQELEREHREFLLALEVDGKGIPRLGDRVAGIDAVYELRRPQG